MTKSNDKEEQKFFQAKNFLSETSNGVKLLYIANIRMPTERAHGVQIVKTCEALGKLGAEVELLVPDRHTPITESLFSYYGIQPLFTVTKTFVLDVLWWKWVGFFVESLSFAIAAAFHARRGYDGVYSRDELSLFFVSLFSVRNVIWESHTGSWNFFARTVAKRARKVVVISHGLMRLYHGRGILPEKIVVIPDGVDLAMFNDVESKSEARKRLGLPENEWIALYVGGFGGWKGVETLLAASELLPGGYAVAIVGGEPQQILETKKKYPRAHFVGARPYREVAHNQAAADVLVLPNTGRDTISAQFTSPLKLFTYMASGIPIVAADLPSVREILDDESAYWFSPDDPKHLAEALSRARAEAEEAAHKAKVAKRIVERYTWDARARAILSCFTHHL